MGAASVAASFCGETLAAAAGVGVDVAFHARAGSGDITLPAT
jgi:hypothetical protein